MSSMCWCTGDACDVLYIPSEFGLLRHSNSDALLMYCMTCRTDLQSSRMFYNYSISSVSGLLFRDFYSTCMNDTDTRFSWGFLDSNVKASFMHSRDSGVITHNPFPPCGLWLFLPFISPLMGLDCSLISSVHSSYTRCSLLLITIMATHPFFFFSAVIGLYYIIIFHCLNPPVLLEYS